MNIGIIGAGNIGTGLGRHLAARGHAIVVSFARTAEALAGAAARIGGGARGGTVAEAVAHGEVIVLATPWGVTLETVRPVAAGLAGKIVWDTTNPFRPGMDELELGTTSSAGEEVARAAPGARVVKAIPPFAELLHSGAMEIGGTRPGVFVCGDDAAARAVVAGLVREVGAAPTDTGPLKLARFTEPAGMLITYLAYVRGLGARVALGVVGEAAGA